MVMLFFKIGNKKGGTEVGGVGEDDFRSRGLSLKQLMEMYSAVSRR